MNAHSFKPNSLAATVVSPAAVAATPADAHYAAVEAELVAEGYGTGPRCVMCRRNQAGCHCDSPEPEQQCFEPANNRDIDNLVDWRRL